MSPHEDTEYRALRDTIRERGTARVWMFVGGLVAWAALSVATAALAALPVATLLPLLVLAGVFEAVYSTHTAVERVGRYLQVFHENAGWEHTAMAYGRAFPRNAHDPLFTLFFVAATFLNFVPVLLAEPAPIELWVVGGAHAVFVVRVIVARLNAGRQRAMDLERFQKLKNL